MNEHSPAWFVGAYALTASLEDLTWAMAKSFYTELGQLPQVQGLELPLHFEPKFDDPWQHLELLPKHFDYILTPLPALMQSLAADPLFGLASEHEAGRQSALQRLDEQRQRIPRLNEHCGRSAVKTLLLHSGPSRKSAANSTARAALRASLDTLLSWDWYGAELCLEHCDAFIAGHEASKGFLDLQTEIETLQPYGIGISINWGRSALEGRGTNLVRAQIEKLDKISMLKALFFSGLTVNDPIYGSWQDNHAPIQTKLASPWRAEGSLLNETEITACLSLCDWRHKKLGVKIQAAPKALALESRLECLRQHIQLLTRLSSGR